MQTQEAPADQVLNLRVGEIVEVRSEAEILATLDGRGELESLPFMPEMLQFCGGARFPFIEGKLEKTPDGTLDLKPGEYPEMVAYCGQQARVLWRVERLVDEGTGRLLSLKRACIVLDDVTCPGEFHRCCPRADYPFWREAWLERVE